MAKERKTHIEITAPILEMGEALEYSSMVPVDRALLQEVTDGDDDPRFVISIVDEQKSRKKVNYNANALELIANQVNSKHPTGYLGHIDDKERDTALPMPQVLWLGSKVIKNMGSKARIVTKGYLFPEGSARSLIKRKGINTVSWSGEGTLSPDREGGYDLIDFVLESIDFARKGREGMPGQSLALVTEMGDELPDPPTERKRKVARSDEDRDDLESIVGHLTIHELKNLNPGLYRTLVEMGKDEVKEEAATAMKAKEEELTSKHEAAVADMPEVKAIDRLRELFKLEKIDDITDEVASILSRLDDLGKELVKNWFKDEILAKKVPERARSIVGRLIPVTEMAGDWRTESGIDKIKKELAEKADELLESDEAVKTVIAEMGANRGGLRMTENGGRTKDDNNNNNNRTDPEYNDADGNKLKSTGNMVLEGIEVG